MTLYQGTRVCRDLPVLSTTRSPIVTSGAGIVFVSPPRMTTAEGEARERSESIVLADEYSLRCVFR